jgi:hypothetical protein
MIPTEARGTVYSNVVSRVARRRGKMGWGCQVDCSTGNVIWDDVIQDSWAESSSAVEGSRASRSICPLMSVVMLILNPLA